MESLKEGLEILRTDQLLDGTQMNGAEQKNKLGEFVLGAFALDNREAFAQQQNYWLARSREALTSLNLVLSSLLTRETARQQVTRAA